ncbi:MAG: hypothetical protein ACP6IU_13440, partial [Candidatus Asgardarchaeia archaeon]
MIGIDNSNFYFMTSILWKNFFIFNWKNDTRERVSLFMNILQICKKFIKQSALFLLLRGGSSAWESTRLK